MDSWSATAWSLNWYSPEKTLHRSFPMSSSTTRPGDSSAAVPRCLRSSPGLSCETQSDPSQHRHKDTGYRILAKTWHCTTQQFCRWCYFNQLMPNTHRRRRRDETVLSRRRQRCVHEFATSWRQFRRVVGVNTPVGSRDPVYNFLCWQVTT